MNQRADVYKAGVKAAKLEAFDDRVEFKYLVSYLALGGPPVATTLPLSSEVVTRPPGSVPSYFAGLLPEGRRLSSIVEYLKTSPDDEMSVLLAVGSEAIGDVQVVPEGASPLAGHEVVDISTTLADLRFNDLLTTRPELVGIAGVQPKISSRVISLPARFRGGEFILKLNPPEFPKVVENEAYFLKLAKSCGLKSAKASIVTDSTGKTGILVRRFDRPNEGVQLAMEDSCQVLDRWPAQKYQITAEEAGRGLSAHCAADEVALLQFVEQVMFAILTGNGDAHAKNFSIVNDGNEWQLAPAYDVPSTVFYGDKTMALSIGGKKQPPGRRRLLDFCENLGTPRRTAERVLDRLLNGTAAMIEEIEAGALELDETRKLTGLKELRYRRKALMQR